MSQRAAKRHFHKWHGHQREPVEGFLDIDYPTKIYPQGKVKEIIYRSTKWQDYPDANVVRRIHSHGGVRNASGPPQRYHHKFSSLFSPTFYDPNSSNNPDNGINPRPLVEDLVCFGTCERFHIPELGPAKKTCYWPESMLPLMLGSEEMGAVIMLFIPSRNEIGFIQGGAFYISPRGIVW